MSKAAYVVITPARNEIEHLQKTIDSVAAQTVLPERWVLVDDGSTDGTGALLDGAGKKYPWIRVIHRADRGFRKSGGGVIEAFYEGYNALQCNDWNFLVKLDGDLSFAFDYFRNDPKLGIGGGEIHHNISGKLKLEENPRFHVRGATKIYTRSCWEGI